MDMIYWIILLLCIVFLIILIICLSKRCDNFSLVTESPVSKSPLGYKTFKTSFNVPPSRTLIERFIDFFSNDIGSFSIPPSLTNVKIPDNEKMLKSSNIKKDYTKELIKKYNKNTIREVLDDISRNDILGHGKDSKTSKNKKDIFNYENGNILTFPTFFDCRDKWPGCLPSPLFQGTCGSCWAFAIATCLSSRYYIESCGNTGCNNYPQLNLEALDITLSNINTIYKFRKVFLSNIHEYIDKNNNKKIDREEWLDAIERAHSESITTKGYKKFYGMQVLLYMLDYQSLGGIHFNKNEPNLDKIIKRGNKTFDLWSEKDRINIIEWEKIWLSQPIPLSAEKLISCCYPHCFDQDSSLFNLTEEEIFKKSTPQCVGGTLVDGWQLMRDAGTTTSLCIGYNLDSWEEGEPAANCKEIQGPFYSYCSGFTIHTDFWNPKFDKVIEESESKNINPINAKNKDENLPWTNPQLFRFRAKNAYEVNDDVITIQREIIERGPVTSGYAIYEDFQFEFGSDGLGGQLYKKGTDPLGGKKNSLIYMWNGKGKQLGGHAIVITGWGTFKFGSYYIPYWICFNSWGREWGTNGYPEYKNRLKEPSKLDGGGYFWIVRGIDNCGIEKNVVAGQPNIDNISYPGTTEKYGWGLPYPDIKNDVKLIHPFENNRLGEDNKLKVEIGPFYKGGGSFNKRLGKNSWSISSMDPPSPFTFFWPDERPVYCIGKIKNNLLNKIDDVYIIVDKSTNKKLREIIGIQNNPLIMIDNEQLQILGQRDDFLNCSSDLKKKVGSNIRQDDEYIYKVSRGVDYSVVEFHPKGSQIKIFPYRDLNLKNLKKYQRCENIYSRSIEEIEYSKKKIE